MSSEPIVRFTRPADSNVLSDIDLKCYPYPFPFEKWKELASESGKITKPKVVVLEVLRKTVGFAVWNEVDENLAQIIRLGVKPGWRHKGLGRVLISKVIFHCQVDKKDALRVVIPDIHCKPGDPDDVSGFLSRVFFHTTGEVVDKYEYMYGEWRDGYIFERNIAHDKGTM